MVSVVPLNLLRSEGTARASMFGSALGSVVNINLDPIFIFKLNMGAAAADLLSAVLAIFPLAKSLGKEWHTISNTA